MRNLFRSPILWLLALCLVLGAVFFGRSTALGEQLDLAAVSGPVEAQLVRNEAVAQSDGSSEISHRVYDLRQDAAEEGAAALLAALGDIPARSRLRLPFERVLVYSSNADSFSVSFTLDGSYITLSMLSTEPTTLHSHGTQGRSYVVEEGSFARLAAIVEQYGSLR